MPFQLVDGAERFVNSFACESFVRLIKASLSLECCQLIRPDETPIDSYGLY
jgi:hypothetical protein